MVLKNKLLFHFWCKQTHSVHLSLVCMVSQSKVLLKLPKNTYQPLLITSKMRRPRQRLKNRLAGCKLGIRNLCKQVCTNCFHCKIKWFHNQEEETKLIIIPNLALYWTLLCSPCKEGQKKPKGDWFIKNLRPPFPGLTGKRTSLEHLHWVIFQQQISSLVLYQCRTLGETESICHFIQCLCR